eukprot:COSAG06_NODE_54005_length_296_cov_0.363636_1_plen_26_part_10
MAGPAVGGLGLAARTRTHLKGMYFQV